MANKSGKGGFKKGISGNPDGRPKSEIQLIKFKEMARAEASKAFQRLVHLAEAARRESDQIKAIELILAYGHGRPSQAVEVSGANGEPLTLRMVDTPPPLTREEWLKHYNKNHAHKT